MRVSRWIAAIILLTTPLVANARPRASSTNPHVASSNQITSTTMRGKENFQRLPNPLGVLERLTSLRFDWASEYGGHREIDCFPANDAATSIPEIIDWEIPGQVIRGVRYDRLSVLLVEAAKQIEDQVVWVYGRVEVVADQVNSLESTVNEHERLLKTHTSQIGTLQSQVAAQDAAIAELKKKNEELEKKVQQQDQDITALKAAIAALQAAMQSR